jgi:hypothetical protein
MTPTPWRVIHGNHTLTTNHTTMTLRQLKEALARVPEKDLDRTLVIRARINSEEYAEDYPEIFFTYTELIGTYLASHFAPQAYLTTANDPFAEQTCTAGDDTQYIFPNS